MEAGTPVPGLVIRAASSITFWFAEDRGDIMDAAPDETTVVAWP